LIVLLTTVIAGTSYLQWHEINAGGKDTHDLAVAAKTQAEKMKSMSDAADKIRQAAQDMVAQDQRIADNAEKSLAASNKQSKAALDATIAASQQSNALAKEALNAQTRPWLGIEGNLTLVNRSSDDTSINIEFEYRLRNYGQSPATKVAQVFTLVRSGKTRNSLPSQKIACDEADLRSSAIDLLTSSLLVSIFPGDSGVTPIRESAGLRDSNSAAYLVGCIAYQGPAGTPTLHHTKMIYQIPLRGGTSGVPVFVLSGTVTD
jgi:hypothetical protein